MKHNLVKWKSVQCESRSGSCVALRIPEIIDLRYRGTLLSRILSMPKKKQISFMSAVQMVSKKQDAAFCAGQFGDQPGQYGWYDLNFVNWISELGYHIDLTGDEFEIHVISSKVS